MIKTITFETKDVELVIGLLFNRMQETIDWNMTDEISMAYFSAYMNAVDILIDDRKVGHKKHNAELKSYYYKITNKQYQKTNIIRKGKWTREN